MSGLYVNSGGSAPRDTTLRDLLIVVFKYKWLILTTTFLATALVAFRTLTSPVTFTADATIMLNRQNTRSSVLERTGRQLPWVEAVESEVQILQSAPVCQGAFEILRERMPEAKLSPERIQRSIKAGVIGESNVIYVSATSREPEVAQAIANAVAESYRNYHGKMLSNPDPTGFVQIRVDSLYVVMQELHDTRQELYGRLGLTDFQTEEQTLIRERSTLRMELSRIDTEVARLQAQAEALREDIRDGRVNLALYENTGSMQVHLMSQVTRDYDIALSKKRELESRFTPQHPELLEINQTLASLEDRMRSWLTENLRARETGLKVKAAERDRLVTELQALDQRLAVLPVLVAQIQMVDAKLASVENQYEDFNEQSVTMALNSASYRDDAVTLLSRAESFRRNKKGDPVRLALGPILALFAGIGLAFYLENLDHSLRNREDVEQHLEIPVLASFPEVSVQSGGDRPSGGSRIPFKRRGSA